MAGVTAIRSVPQAIRQLKRMNYQGEGWESYWEAGRLAVKKVLEGLMERIRRRYLEDIAAQGADD